MSTPKASGTPGDADASAGGGEPVRRPPGLRLEQLLTVTDETDEHRRLLLEDSAPERAIRRAVRAGIAMDATACPYRDTPSRHGGPMNTSAYEALRRDTTQILDGLAWLGEQYRAQEPDQHATVQGLADLSKLGITIPLVLFHRGRDPVRRHGELPSYIAAIFKASRGMFSAAFDMVAKAGPGPTTAAEVVAFAEEHGHLRRAQTATVCAAPTRLIQRTVSVMLTGEGADPASSQLSELVAFDRLWKAFRLERAFNQNLSSYGYVLERLTAAGWRTDDPALFDETVRVAGGTGTFGDLTDAFLRYANQAQALLNRALERAENAPPMTFTDVLRAL
ncbi:MAG: hypothetical protein WD080_05480 [Egibacteraceae bacterium]